MKDSATRVQGEAFLVSAGQCEAGRTASCFQAPCGVAACGCCCWAVGKGHPPNGKHLLPVRINSGLNAWLAFIACKEAAPLP